MVKKFSFLVLSVCLFAFISLGFASGLNSNFTNVTGGIERTLSTASSSNLINFSVGALSENVTKVQFVITGSTVGDEDKFIVGSNGSSASAFFVNSTSSSGGYGMSHTLILTFTNFSAAGIIPNSSVRNFWFNINSKSGAASDLSIMVNATGISGTTNNSVTYSWPFTFRFSGYVKNETGDLMNATNVSIYSYSEGMGGPVETLISQTQTGSAGNFTLTGLSAAGANQYKLRIIHYNSSGQAVKISTNLPAFPAEMYYPKVYGSFDENPAYAFMRQPSLNGTTFYVGAAATLNISATNDTTTVQRFGYMVMEQGTGFPLESVGNGNVTNAQVIVPLNRWYTVMVMRSNSAFGDSIDCNGTFMNATNCKTPPKSNSTIYPAVEGQFININLNLAISRKYMSGCIGVSGNSTPITNVSLILPKMMPWSGFVPPARADVQDINLSNRNQLNYSDSRCVGKVAWYNISVLNSDYFVEFYGRNNTASRGGEFVGALQNASFTSSDQTINITLLPLSGTFTAATSGEISQGTGTNTTKFTIRVQNSTGAAVTSDRPHIEVTLKNSLAFSEVTYVAEATNGSFTLMIPQGLNGKVKVFSNNAPPKEKLINSSKTELNITLVNMQGGDGGFRVRNASGQLEAMNITQDSFNVLMGFFRAGGSCDVLSPPSSCNLTSMGARNFNPFVALVAGKVNMQMRLSSGVSIVFYNFDMFSAKQPPMESVMNNEAASGGSSANQIWEFGSFVPADVYDYAIVSIPYSDSIINDSAEIRMTIPTLYDENWNAVWNSSRGDTSLNLTTSVDDYLGNSNNRSFNASGYRNFLQSGGVICNSTNGSIVGANPAVYCYTDTANNLIYMRVPHFSGVSPSISGSAPSSDSGAVATTSPGASSGTLTVNTWSNTYVEDDKDFSQKISLTKELAAKNRVKIKFNDEIHYVGVLSISGNNQALIQVQSTPINATLSVGGEERFDLNSDGVYDLVVKLNSISNGKASLTMNYIQEDVPETSEIGVGPGEEGGMLTIGDGLKNNWKIIVIGVIIFVVLVIALFIYFSKRGNRHR